MSIKFNGFRLIINSLVLANDNDNDNENDNLTLTMTLYTLSGNKYFTFIKIKFDFQNSRITTTTTTTTLANKTRPIYLRTFEQVNLERVPRHYRLSAKIIEST